MQNDRNNSSSNSNSNSSIFFINSNPGLKSRFNRFIDFEDYTGVQLLQIYQKMAREAGYETTEEALDYAEEFFEEKALNKGEQATIGFNASLQKKIPIVEGSNSSNARMVRNFLETAVMNQADRLYDKLPITDEELCTIEYEDLKSIA